MKKLVVTLFVLVLCVAAALGLANVGIAGTKAFGAMSKASDAKITLATFSAFNFLPKETPRVDALQNCTGKGFDIGPSDCPAYGAPFTGSDSKTKCKGMFTKLHFSLLL